MKFSNVMLLSMLGLGATTFGKPVPARADTPATQGDECSFIMAAPSFSCQTISGDFDDVRFYVTEFQDCTNGKITNMDRSITGYVGTTNADGSPHIKTLSGSSPSLSIQYSPTRFHLPDRADNLTMIMPSGASMKIGTTTYQIAVDFTKPLDFGPGTDLTVSYSGTVTKTTADGTVTSTGMDCGIDGD